MQLLLALLQTLAQLASLDRSAIRSTLAKGMSSPAALALRKRFCVTPFGAKNASSYFHPKLIRFKNVPYPTGLSDATASLIVPYTLSPTRSPPTLNLVA